MYLNQHKLSVKEVSMESGIISFKTLKDGFMAFNGGLITEESVSNFILELDNLIMEISSCTLEESIILFGCIYIEHSLFFSINKTFEFCMDS